MPDAISPSSSPYPFPSQTPSDSQRLFEIQFETAVLAIFVDVTQKNGSIKKQISHLKDGIQSGEPPAELATALNQLVSQINMTVIPGKSPFPTFLFTSEGSQVQALTHHAITLEKCLNTLSEKGILPWPEESKLFAELSTLINFIPQTTPEQAFSKINEVIETANAQLPPHYQIPPLR